MGQYLVKILDAEFINHDVKRFIVEKPLDYNFIPGQGTEIAIDEPEWKHELRPFTFTSLNSQNHLEFLVKIYNDHNGVTHQLGKTNAGSNLIIGEPFGAITYRGPGVFLAGGSGITPFISIFRQLYKNQLLRGNKLIYSNKSSDDFILAEELHKMLKADLVPFFTHEGNIGFAHHYIDRNFLIDVIHDFGQFFYICGPDGFVKDLSKMLLDLGANISSLVVEN